MKDLINNFRNELTRIQASSRFASFLMRRLSVIGTVYALMFGAVLLLELAWRGEDKKSGATLTLFSHFDKTAFGQAMEFRVQLAVAVTLLLLCLGISRKYIVSRLCGTALLIPFVLPPVWLTGDLESVILMRFLHGVLLLSAGLILDRTFGCTRSLARSDFYLDRLGVIEQKADGDKKTEELHKLFEACAVDKYRDHVGDTFFTLDAIKAKLV